MTRTQLRASDRHRPYRFRRVWAHLARDVWVLRDYDRRVFRWLGVRRGWRSGLRWEREGRSDEHRG
jgi:hypothetical protein